MFVFILIQFVRPEKNISKKQENDISKEFKIPKNIQEIIKNSCADCHSNNTNYPWYSEIAPVSWYLAMHVNKGKEHLNFSEWTVYNNNQKKHIFSDLEEVIESHEMPLKSYLLLHKEVEINNSQYNALYDWVKTLKVE